MAKKIVAGNWKMNKCLFEAESLMAQILETSETVPQDVSLIVAPPALYLTKFAKMARKYPNVSIAAQNAAYAQHGAYTGEISADMLKAAGIEFAIIGHSERRSLFGETDEVLAKKVDACLEFGVQPIFCIGEQLEEREADRHFEVVTQQLEQGILHLDANQIQNTVLAYEPVWAIGTGKTASAEQAQEIHAHIRSILSAKYGAEVAQNVSILYGGSCKPENAVELFAGQDVDGGLIGGASLVAKSFISIAQSFESSAIETA